MKLGTTLAMVVMVAMTGANAQEAIEIGSRLELMVDNYLIESVGGEAQLRLHHPVRREIVFRTDAPWEGNASAFQSVFRDGDLYRMYYRGIHYRHSGEPAQAREDHPWHLCYAESDDGINWRRPDLGLFEFDGSKANNIILTPEFLSEIGGDPAHTSAFLDLNPACPPEQKYKITVVGHKPKGLYVLASPDGIHFTPMSAEPSVTNGAFDSQNLMFFDPAAKVYREYHRGFRDGVRAIMTATSTDILHFPEPDWLQYEDSPHEHLYTNQIQPYYRAPHILMGFPMRYSDRGWSDAMAELPGFDERIVRVKSSLRYGTAITDALFMSSRDGREFKRWPEAFIRPGPRQKRSWVYGDNFVFWGMVETASATEDAPDEISLYATEGYWEGIGTDVRRYTIRVDGFVSAAAPLAGGEIVTRPIVFEGGSLALNLETSGAGGVQVEIQDAQGTPIPGYSMEECPPIFGDSLRQIVRWEDVGGDVGPLAGRPVKLRIALRDADIYSLQFVPNEPDPVLPELEIPGIMPRKNHERAPFVAVDEDFASALDAETGSRVTIREGSPDGVQTLNDDPVGSGQPGERNYLKISREDEGFHDGGSVWVALSPRDAADSAGGIIEVTARIYVPSSNASRVDLDAYDNLPGVFERRAFHVRFSPDGRVTYYRDEEHPVPELTLAPDTWQDVFIRADLAAGVFDLTVGGETVEGLPFARDDVHRVQSIAICPNSRNSTIYLDSLKVRVMP